MIQKLQKPSYTFLMNQLKKEFKTEDNPQCKILTEYRFDEFRKYRFDIAILYYKIAIEIEGGVYTQGRHTRGVGYMKDIEKYNRAAFLGWCVFRIAGHEAVDPCKVVPFVDMIKNSVIQYEQLGE